MSMRVTAMTYAYMTDNDATMNIMKCIAITKCRKQRRRRRAAVHRQTGQQQECKEVARQPMDGPEASCDVMMLAVKRMGQELGSKLSLPPYL